jgi:hypothetical protein
MFSLRSEGQKKAHRPSIIGTISPIIGTDYRRENNMVRSTLTLSQTFDGFVYYKTATGKSPHTIADYRITQKKVMTFFEVDPFFVAITRTEWVKFLRG